MPTHIYYPQIKWKSAEFEALSVTPTSVINGMIPIISIPDIEWDYVNSRYKKSLTAHLTDFPVNLSNSWPSQNPVFLDVGELDKHATQINHPLANCISGANNFNKAIIPVYSPTYSALYLASVLRNTNHGIALKFNPSNLNSLFSTYQNTGLSENNIDIIFDMGDIQQVNQNLVVSVETAINHILNSGNWRRVIFSSTCYPSSQAGIPQHTVHKIPRYEWSLWSQLIQRNNMARTPGYSDYPTSSATTEPVDPRIMSLYVSIRYSDYLEWVFVKGTAAKGNGWAQTQQLCQILIQDPCYKGASYSWGDNHIMLRANGNVKSGSPKEWRKAAQSHHFNLVVDQLSQFSKTHPPKP
jgi:hypothetical protein